MQPQVLSSGQSAPDQGKSTLSAQILIVGGGAAGIAVASSLRARDSSLDVAIIDPAEVHYYQPGWTLVGAGVFQPKATVRTMASLIPDGVRWIKGAGAPQKALYLSCDHWLKAGLHPQIKSRFFNAGAVLFGVADYVPALMKYIDKYAVDLQFNHTLVAVDGPLTVERGKIVLAEFTYGGKLAPSFAPWLLDGRKPTRRAWWLKERILPALYWRCMLRGREWLARPTRLSGSAEK